MIEFCRILGINFPIAIRCVVIIFARTFWLTIVRKYPISLNYGFIYPIYYLADVS